jgi:hypothetical protein
LQRPEDGILYTISVVESTRRGEHCISRPTQAAFYTHFLGDFLLTVYPLAYLWPFAETKAVYERALYLGHPLNTALVYAGLAVFGVPHAAAQTR